MLGPVAHIDKRPVVFIDTLSATLRDIFIAFHAQFVLTSNVALGSTHAESVAVLVQMGFEFIADNLHSEWATTWDGCLNVEEQVEGWHAAAAHNTPNAHLLVTTTARAATLGHIAVAYAVAIDELSADDSAYLNACRILHSQTSFAPFDSDWY